MNSLLVQKLRVYEKVLIIGPYPPPLGGVSIHIYRLLKILNNADIFDISQKRKYFYQKYLILIKLILNGKYDAIHIHSYDIKICLLLLLFNNFKNFDLIITSHNSRLFEINNSIKKNLYKKIIEHIDILVVVGKHILDDYKERSVNLPKQIIVEPAFLPPPESDEFEIMKTYPKVLFDFIDRHSHIILANAFQVSFHNGIDLYGLDMCVKLISKLKNTYPNIGFIFAIANEKVNIKYLKKIKNKINELSIDSNFYFLTGQKEIWPLFKNIDLFIRPTTTDGDALSIREALYFKCPVIASNVCKRPKGTILFKNRDFDDFFQQVVYTLNKCRF